MKPILARLTHGWCHTVVIGRSSLNRLFNQALHRAYWDTIDRERTQVPCLLMVGLASAILASSYGVIPFKWHAFIRFAPGATILPLCAWTTLSPSPTTKSRQPCSRPTTSAAPST